MKLYELNRPYNEWPPMDIYRAIVDYRRDNDIPKLKNALNFPRINKDIMRREFLTMNGVKNGRDVYKINTDRCKSLTEEELELLVKKGMHQTRRTKFPTTYIVEYIVEDDKGFHIVQDKVLIRKWNQEFDGRDGKHHYLQERGCKVIEIIYP